MALSEAEKARYYKEGYVVPDYRLPEAQVASLRDTVNYLIEANPGVRPEQLVNAHLASPSAEGVRGAAELLELAKEPEILDLVEDVIGQDIILWGCQLFCKPAGDGMEVPWHQDGQYWPIRPLATCTVWIAIDDSLVSNGCLRVVPGSHSDQQLHSHYTDDRERLTLTQAIEPQHLDEEAFADVELRAGQMSLHDVYLVHGSNVNTSVNRRAGLAIRYMPASSEFNRDLIEPSDKSGYKVDFSRRPLWLLRGQDSSGKNDFSIGHA
ncbi:phytanoyl-CoA dioxygenase [Chromatiales bacterium (ex Bugula neritina AB1)]|nr:phytanoyl-CoA dioxygenase [Chromatiales bacterium (ex Bugula neritina AB1)]